MSEYVFDQQNYRIIIYCFAIIAFWPVFWDAFYTPFFGKRAKAVKHGADLIYKKQSILTFYGVALGWAKSDNISYEDTIELLIPDLWMGLFEDKKGQTELYIAGKTTSGNIPVTRYYLLNASFNFFNVVQKNKANPKNITFKLDGKPTNSEIDAIDWTYLASLKLADYENKTHNKMYAKGNQKSVSVYIKDIIIPKTYFIRWLIKLKYPLPKRWYEKN